MSRILYVQTGGVSTPERSATPIYLATTAAAMDIEIGIYFAVNGPTLLLCGFWPPSTRRTGPSMS